MRLLRHFPALPAALALAAPALAQEAPQRPDWVGVWQGTIGRYPVVACFDQRYNGDGQGSYYYLSQLKPIALQAGDGARGWVEGNGNGETGSAAMPEWDFASVGSDRIGGTWRAGERRLAIALERIPDGAEDYDHACAAANFLQPRVAEPKFGEEVRSLGDLAYTELRYEPPGWFADVEITGFAFAPEQPGDGSIGQWLAAKLPQGRVDDEFIQCLAGVLMVHGVDGYYSLSLSPAFANGDLLAVTVGSSTYCGGAHPNHWQEFHTFDRKTGEALDPAGWFGPTAMETTEYGSSAMLAPLRAAVMRHWPRYADEADDCSSFVVDHEWWIYQAQREGVLFQPDLPHVVTACEERLLVPWSELAPFLSEAGRRVRDRATR